MSIMTLHKERKDIECPHVVCNFLPAKNFVQDKKRKRYKTNGQCHLVSKASRDYISTHRMIDVGAVSLEIESRGTATKTMIE